MRIQPVTGQIYHVYNRGVEKRKIFMNDQDRFRFIHDLYEFNDEAPALNTYYKPKLPNFTQSYEIQSRKISKIKERRMTPRKRLVDILAFCMMPNHFHLLLRQKVDKGISEFMKKLGIGYTMYFNKMHERVGSLFQNKYKAVLVKNESHLLHLPYYIHVNPLDIIEPGWHEDGFNMRKVTKYLESYRWSSYLDYIGKNNFPSVIDKYFLNQYFQNNVKQETVNWLKNIKEELENIKEVSID